MNGILKRGLITLAVAGGFVALGAGAAYADDGTDGDGGLLSGLQGIVNVQLPVTISGNGISVGGSSSSSGASSSAPASGGSSSGSTSGSNSLLGGTQGIIGANVPVTVSGNAISVLGDSSSEGSSFAGASGQSDNGSASTTGKEGILGGTQVLGDVNAPVTVSGNAISVIGDSSSNEATTTAGASGSGSSVPSGTTTGTDSVLGGTQVLGDVGAPIAVGGNAISVLGDSSSTGSTVGNGTGGSTGSGSTGTTSGDDGILGGTQAIVNAAAPVVAGGNAVSVLGDSSSTGSAVTNGTGGTASGSDASTTGSDSTLGGSQVVADVISPITAGGNAVSIVGDSSSTGSATTAPATGGNGTATTTGDDGVLGGTQVLTGVDAPVTVGGNAISVIGDSTVDNPTTGGPTDPTDPGDVGGETITPPASGDVAGVTTSALLAQTGSTLSGWMLAVAMLLLAAGVTFVARTRTARA